MEGYIDGGMAGWVDVWVTQLDYKLIHSRIHGIYVYLLFVI